jgi:hypothetical protein
MNWMLWYNVIMRYYPGENLQTIPKMTVWQFVQTIRNIGWLEKQGQEQQRIASSAGMIEGQDPGKVPTIADIRARAKQINPNLKIPKE